MKNNNNKDCINVSTKNDQSLLKNIELWILAIIKQHYRRYYFMYRKTNLTFEEMLNVAWLAALEAMKCYDPSKRATMKTFLWICIRRQVHQHLNEYYRWENRIALQEKDGQMQRLDIEEENNIESDNPTQIYKKLSPYKSTPEAVLISKEKWLQYHYLTRNLNDYEKYILYDLRLPSHHKYSPMADKHTPSYTKSRQKSKILQTITDSLQKISLHDYFNDKMNINDNDF